MSGSGWGRQSRANGSAVSRGSGAMPSLPATAPSSESFSEVLRRYFHHSGSSITQLAHGSWLDSGYVSRLLSQNWDPLNPPLVQDERPKQPSRDAVIRLGLGLGLAVHEVDELLMAAGYAPLVR